MCGRQRDAVEIAFDLRVQSDPYTLSDRLEFQTTFDLFETR